MALAYVPEYELVWSGDADGALMVWSATTLECEHAVAAAHGGAIFDIALVSMRLNEQTSLELWTAAKDGRLRVWDAENFACVRELKGHDMAVAAVAQVGPSLVWSVGELAIRIWDQSRIDAYDMRIVPYENGDKYVGEIVGDVGGGEVREGRGELHRADGARQVGRWRGDALDGFGIDTAADGTRYYGHFHKGQRHGRGVLVMRDGTVFDGSFVRDQRKGAGTMRWPNGDELRGQWNGDAVKDGRVVRGAALAVDRCARELWRRELVRVDAALDAESNAPASRRTKRPPALPVAKWRALEALTDTELDRLTAAVRVRFAAKPPPASASAGNSSGGAGSAPSSADKRRKRAAKAVAEQEATDARLNADALSIVLSDSDNVVGQILTDFVFLFKSTYHFSYGACEVQLENAIDDLHSFAARLSDACGRVFPRVKKRQREELVTELVLSRVYASLIDLYKSVNAKRDQMLTVKIDSLSAVTMKEIGVGPKFWLGWQPKQKLLAAAPLFASHSRFGSGPSATAAAKRSPGAGATTTTESRGSFAASKYYTLQEDDAKQLGEQLSKRLENDNDDSDDDDDDDDGVAAAGKLPIGAHEELDDVDEEVPAGVDLHASIDSSAVLPLPHLGARRRVEVAERLERARAPYWNAVASLHEIRRYRTVARKLQSLLKVSAAILNAVTEFDAAWRAARTRQRDAAANDNVADDGASGSDSDGPNGLVLGSEDKFPILSYVVVRANVPALFSELQLIRDFAHPTQLREEAGFRLVELEQAVEYVNTLDWNLCDTDGVLVPLRIVEQRVLSALSAASAEFARETTRVPRVLWLAELLLLCGTRRGATGFTIDELEYSFVHGPESAFYIKLGQHVLGVLGLALRVEKNSAVRVEFVKPYPLYVYTHVSRLIQGQQK